MVRTVQTNRIQILMMLYTHMTECQMFIGIFISKYVHLYSIVMITDLLYYGYGIEVFMLRFTLSIVSHLFAILRRNSGTWGLFHCRPTSTRSESLSAVFVVFETECVSAHFPITDSFQLCRCVHVVDLYMFNNCKYCSIGFRIISM